MSRRMIGSDDIVKINELRAQHAQAIADALALAQSPAIPSTRTERFIIALAILVVVVGVVWLVLR